MLFQLVRLKATIKPEVFSGSGKLRHKHLKYFSKCIQITPCSAHMVLNGASGSKRDMIRNMTRGTKGLQQAGLRSTSSKWYVAIFCWLFEWLQVSSIWKRTVFERLSSKICICLKSNETGSTENPGVPGWGEHHSTGTSWSCSVWLSSFLQAQGDYQRDQFWRRVDHQDGRNDGSEWHPRRRLPADHRKVAEKDGKVYYTRGGLLWRGNYLIYCLELQ